MTPARQIIPGSRYLATRRCSERRYLLRPSPIVNQIVEYSIALAAQRAKVLLHAAAAMGNHAHSVGTDPEGRLPDFTRDFHSLVARCCNVVLGRSDRFWDGQQASDVRLEDDEAVLDRIAYTLCNPTAAGLVAYGHEWPGVRTRPQDLAGFEKEVRRPNVLLRANGPLPDKVTLRIVPPQIAGMSPKAIARDVEDRVRAREQELRRERSATKRPVLGRKAVLATNPFDSPEKPEERRVLRPKIAASTDEIRKAGLERLADFGQKYRGALVKWMAGIRDVIFPFGTYLLRLRSAVLCAAPEPAPT